MKTIKFAAIMLAMMASFSFSSCSSDDDNKGANIEQPAKYADKAARYVVNGNAQYKSIELTESGNYLIEKGGSYYSRTAAKTRSRKHSPLLGKFLAANAQTTRSTEWDNYVYGNFTLNSDGSFNLEGIGRLEVKANEAGQYSLVLTPKGKDPVTLSAQKVQNSVSRMTAKLCRTWRFDSYRIVLVDRNGKTLFDHSDSDARSFGKWLYNWEKKNDPDFDEEDWYEIIDGEKVYEWEDEDFEVAETIMFTQSGTYLIKSDDYLEVDLWRWHDENKGLLEIGERYNGKEYWDADWYITVSFSGNKMVTVETDEEVEDEWEDDCIYNGTTGTYYTYFTAIN